MCKEIIVITYEVKTHIKNFSDKLLSITYFLSNT